MLGRDLPREGRLRVSPLAGPASVSVDQMTAVGVKRADGRKGQGGLGPQSPDFMGHSCLAVEGIGRLGWPVPWFSLLEKIVLFFSCRKGYCGYLRNYILNTFQ